MNSFIVKGNIVWAETNKELKSAEKGYLVIKDGLSEGVFDSIPEEYMDYELIDAGDNLVVPGLVDLHVHAPQFAFRGTNMDLELMDWLNTYTFPEESKFSDISYADNIYSYFTEAIKKSATTRVVAFSTLHVEGTMCLMDKLEKSGIISYVGKVNMDRNSPDELREESAEASSENTIRWLEECEKRGYRCVKPILTPRFVPSCTDELMEKLSVIRKEWRLPVQSHLSENTGEVAFVKELEPWSQFYGDAYDKFGLFGGEDGCIMAHCVLSGEDEIALMKKNGVFIAHCPESNENLKSGIAPVRKYMEEGLNVGLGSDIAGGTTESIFDAAVDAVKVSKLYWRYVDNSFEPLSFSDAFYLATKGGGAFFGKVGSFEKGYDGDVLILSDEAIPCPRYLSPVERLERFAYLHGDKTGIKGKWVKGERIL
ncbi:MAG: amidohydrolase family protein [Spirochaetales bacterium]|nr:amidohydrolase family protein [Spirochaetales bacterium]